MKSIEYLSKTCAGSDVPHRTFGAPNVAEYEKWSPHICSICCLKMVADTLGLTNTLSLYQLTLLAVSQGVFRENKPGKIEGAYHIPLLKLAQSLGLKGQLEKNLTVKKIIQLLHDGKYVILSVDKEKIDSALEGGHLLLIHSYDPEQQQFVVNDPEPLLAENGANVLVGLETLALISNERGISLRNVNAR